MGCKQASSDGNDEADSSELIGDSVRPPSFANDDEMLDFIQRVHLNYMWDGAEANSGLARERIRASWISWSAPTVSMAFGLIGSMAPRAR